MSTSAVVAAILAGGRASRLGGLAKGSLFVGGRPILERQLEALRPVFCRVIVIADEPGPWTAMGLHVVPDRVPGPSGPLAGIDAALSALLPHEAGVVCVGCDMPFLQTRALSLLRDTNPNAIAVAAKIGAFAEPLFARYSRDASKSVAKAATESNRAAHRLLESMGARWLDEATLRALDDDLTFLLNVNTPEDLARANAVAHARGW
jgi:molybdenum cofactor guanylyltransferase